jgi:hypothetical protein
MTPNYYIPKTTVLYQLALVVHYYTFEPVPILNPTSLDLELECNQFLTWLEQLHNLERRPSHRYGSQQPKELVEVVMTPIAIC